MTPHKDQDFEDVTVSPYVRETLNVGSDIIYVKSTQETYPHLAVLDPVRYSYRDTEMILGQDVYNAIRPLEYCSRLGFKWPTSSRPGLFSTSFIANVKQDYELSCQVRSSYDMESYMQIDPRFAAAARAHEISETSTSHNDQRYDVPMLWADDNVQFPNKYFVTGTA